MSSEPRGLGAPERADGQGSGLAELRAQAHRELAGLIVGYDEPLDHTSRRS